MRFAEYLSAGRVLAGCGMALAGMGCGTSGVDIARDAGMAGVSGSPTSVIGKPQVYRVPSESMEPTLRIGSTVHVGSGSLAVGAIVVFHPSEGGLAGECGPRPHVPRAGGAACDTPIREESRLRLIKRIVAGPGDEIYIENGHVFLKAHGSTSFLRESDSYIRPCGVNPECNFPVPIKIPAGQWFVMGDNRGASTDSRAWGPVPKAWIVGVVAS